MLGVRGRGHGDDVDTGGPRRGGGAGMGGAAQARQRRGHDVCEQPGARPKKH